MKIKTKALPYERAVMLKRPKKRKPIKSLFILRLIIRLAAIPDLLFTGFKYRSIRMDLAGDGPWLILMNHSSFIDLEIVSKIMFPRPYNIICTSDGFVGKEWLMRLIGCIPTQKFVTSPDLIGDIRYCLRELKSSVLMYPEASYSFDGTATPLPRRMGVLLKRLGVPVVMITTHGAFARDPLYNGLQKRRVKVSADVECLLTPQEIAEKSVAEIDDILDRAFSFDNFRWQQENNVIINEKFRADYLNRILYKCCDCGNEGSMEGKGITLRCKECGRSWTLTELGRLEASEGETRFPHIPDWYSWQRNSVKEEILENKYMLDVPVDIAVLVDYKSIKKVGSGRLIHDSNGFALTGCDGKLEYTQPARAGYSLYSDYYWYEIGDVICIGNSDVLYYCFPKGTGDIVAKTRLAAEEMYKLYMESRKRNKG